MSVTLFTLFRIIGAGVGVVVTQNLGGRRSDAANKVALTVLGASTRLGSAGALVALFGAQDLMQMLRAPADVMPIAVPFLQSLLPAL